MNELIKKMNIKKTYILENKNPHKSILSSNSHLFYECTKWVHRSDDRFVYHMYMYISMIMYALVIAHIW